MFRREKFFNRNDILDNLKKRLDGFLNGYRQNIAILGPESIGKTWLVKYFLSCINDTKLVAIYIDMMQPDIETIINKFIGALIMEYFKNNNITSGPYDNINSIIEASRNYIPKTFEKISLLKADMQRQKLNKIFKDCLGVLEIFSGEAELKMLIVIDEFQQLQRLNIKDAFKELGKRIVLEHDIMYVFTSSKENDAKEILSKELALLFGNFEIIDLPPFDINTSREFIQQRITIEDTDNLYKDFLIYLTGGNPFYLDIILKELNNLIQTKQIDIFTPSLLIKALMHLLFYSDGILNHKFINYLNQLINRSDSKNPLPILICISQGFNKIKDIQAIIHKTKRETAILLSPLIRMEALSLSGDFLKFNDRMFSFWIRFVHQEKSNNLNSEVEQIDNFKKGIGYLIEEFKTYRKRDVTDRVMELFKLFGNNSIQIEKHKFRLTHLKEIVPLRFAGSGIKTGVLGRGKDCIWITALKDERVLENDIREFISECKKYKYRTQKRIVVALKDIDLTAALLAKEQKVMTWDIHKINSILELYNKPLIIK